MNFGTAFTRLYQQHQSLLSGTYMVELTQVDPEIYLACSSDGRPAFFISVAQGGDSPGIRLRNLELRHKTRGVLRTSDGTSLTGSYTLVECLSHDLRLHRVFVDFVTEVITEGAAWRTTDELEKPFTSLIELFSAAAEPPTTSWLGAWGELFLIHSSPQSARVLAYWHVDPLNLHDFALGSDRLECKATTGRSRVHDFGLTQLDETERTVFVASIVTHETPGGVSALTLYDEIRERVEDPELRVHLDKILVRMLGDNLNSMVAPRYDYEEAQQTLRIICAEDIPAPVNCFPNLVSAVRFLSDVSHCKETVRERDLLRLLG